MRIAIGDVAVVGVEQRIDDAGIALVFTALDESEGMLTSMSPSLDRVCALGHSAFQMERKGL